jgi:hypothetical protein
VWTDESGQTWQTNLVTGETVRRAAAVEKPAKSRGLINVTLPGGEQKTVFEMNDGTLQDTLGNRFYLPEGAATTKVGSAKAADTAAIIESIGKTGASLAGLVNLRSMLKPGLVGWRGALARPTSGIAESLPFVGGQKTGDWVAEETSGFGLPEGSEATQAELIEYRQLAQQLSIEMRGVFTGELGKRISETEREIALREARLLATASSLTQVDVATRNLMRLYLKADMADRIAKGQPLAFDLSTDEGVVSADRFIQQELGVGPEESRRWIKEFYSQQRISQSLGVSSGQ